MPPASRILIAGEDTIIANLASTMLQKKGYTIAGILTNGRDALVKTVDLVPDLVIMDVNLGGMLDGIDAAHYIYQIFHVPVLFISAVSEETKLARIKYSLPYGIVFKPFNDTQLATYADLALYTHADRIGALGNSPLGDSRKMMDNPNEAIIILDKRGRVIFFNTFAEWFVDMPLEKAFVRHWRDVMMFMSDADNEEVSDPVTRATKQMAGSIYDGGISIVSTTSKRRKIHLAIRPLRDSHERLIASIMSIKENKKTYM
ncbi:MAG: response regulator [Methanoregula sp.]